MLRPPSKRRRQSCRSRSASIANSVESRLHFARPHVDGFEDWLRDHGYTPSTIEERVRLLAGWADWMHAAGFALDNILDGLDCIRSGLQREARRARAYVGAGRLFIRYLQDRGRLPRSAPPPSPAEIWPILGAFRTWVRHQRGCRATRRSISGSDPIVDLLEALGDDPKAYTAQALRAFMLERAKPLQRRARARSCGRHPRASSVPGGDGAMPCGPRIRHSWLCQLAACVDPADSWLRTMSSAPLPLAMAKAGSAIGRSFCCLPVLGCGRARSRTSSSPISTGKTGGLPSSANPGARNGFR